MKNLRTEYTSLKIEVVSVKDEDVIKTSGEGFMEQDAQQDFFS